MLSLTVTLKFWPGRVSVPIDLKELDGFDPFTVPTIRYIIIECPVLCCVQSLVLRADVIYFYYFSQICEELDRPRKGEEEEKFEDIKENETDAAERRKIRGEIVKYDFCRLPLACIYIIKAKLVKYDLNCK